MVTIDNSKSFLRELVRLNNYNFIACGYEKLSVTGTAGGLSNVPADARYALMELEGDKTAGAMIRYLELGDTTLPTSTTGLRKSDMDGFDVHGYQNLINFRAIQIAPGTNSINVQYYK